MSVRSGVLLSALLAGCYHNETLSPVEPPAPVLGEPVPVVPFAHPPDGVVTQNANNNLDVIEHEGRYYFGFRTAPSHFASAETVLYIVSSTDQETWTLEASFTLGTDLREPRFLSFEGKLFFYFSVLGKDPLKFQPEGVRMSRYQGPGQWSDPVSVHEPGFLLWRSRTIAGKPYLLGYIGGENIYEVNEEREPIDIHFLTTADGEHLEPVVPGKPVVSRGGGSETDVAFLEDGSLVAIIRNEEGDEVGWGSKICRAPADDLGAWACTGDKRKYDSPIVFREGSRVFLIARRQVTENGYYDLEKRDLSPADQTANYLVEYSFSPKRCALWEIAPEKPEVVFLQDLPSHGDTCFPGLISHGEGKYTVYNYTSPLSEVAEDYDWVKGQVLPTDIYRISLDIPAP